MSTRPRAVAALALLGIVAGIVAACGTADSRPDAQENEARIAQSVAATLDAQSQIQRGNFRNGSGAAA